MEELRKRILPEIRLSMKRSELRDLHGSEPEGDKRKKTAAGIAAALAALLLKGKGLLIALLKLFKLDVVLQLFKLGNMGGTLVTMGLMAWTYAVHYGWRFAIGLVLLIFVHEMGHYLAARQEGLSVSAPVFIPFIGALIGMKEKPANAEVEGKVAIAGPLAGMAGSLLLALGWLLTGHELLQGLLYVNLAMTLFNLIPFGTLDGGRVSSSLSGRYWIIGLVLFAGVALAFHNPVLIVILIAGSLNAWKERKKDRESDPYYDISEEARSILGTLYFGALLVNGLGLAVLVVM